MLLTRHLLIVVCRQGLLNFPHAFEIAGGLKISILIQIAVWSLVVGALFILTHCTAITQSQVSELRQVASVVFNCAPHRQSFQEVVEKFCGRRTSNLTSIAIIMYSYGACLTFLIVIGDQYDRGWSLRSKSILIRLRSQCSLLYTAATFVTRGT